MRGGGLMADIVQWSECPPAVLAAARRLAENIWFGSRSATGPNPQGPCVYATPHRRSTSSEILGFVCPVLGWNGHPPEG